MFKGKRFTFRGRTLYFKTRGVKTFREEVIFSDKGVALKNNHLQNRPVYQALGQKGLATVRIRRATVRIGDPILY